MAKRDSDGELDLAARVARLTAGQRACLELVDDHATSKEIALRLGISRHTVDARLRQAMQTLRVTSRREAAVIWRAAAGTEEYQPFAYQSSQIEPRLDVQAEVTSETEYSDVVKHQSRNAAAGAEPISPLHRRAPELSRQTADEDGLLEVADSAPIYWSASHTAAAETDSLPGVRLWGGANDLTTSQRLGGILVVALLGMLAFGLLLSGIEALSNLRA